MGAFFVQGERGMEGAQGPMGPPGTGIQGNQVTSHLLASLYNPAFPKYFKIVSGRQLQCMIIDYLHI